MNSEYGFSEEFFRSTRERMHNADFGGWHTNGPEFIRNAYLNQDDVVSPQSMLSTIQTYLHQIKGIPVRINWPGNDRELQLLGRAYDIAVGKSVRHWDGGKAKLCPNAKAHACNCIANLCTNKEIKGSKSPDIQTVEYQNVEGNKIKIVVWKEMSIDPVDRGTKFTFDMGSGSDSSGDVFQKGIWDEAIKAGKNDYAKWKAEQYEKQNERSTWCSPF